MAWLLEEYKNLIKLLSEKKDKETNPERKKILEEALGKISYECVNLQRTFRCVYIGKELPYLEE